MSILALDPGVQTGWCRSDGTSGVIDSGRYADRGEAISKFCAWLGDQFSSTQTQCLAIERPFLSGGRFAGSDFTHGLVWAAHGVAYLHGVPRRERTANEVRQHVLGRCRKLRGESEAMFDRAILQAVQARGFFPEREHAADAAALVVFLNETEFGVQT